MKKVTEAGKALEAASVNLKNTVVNVKEASDVVKTIDPAAAGMALGLAIFGTFMAPHFVAKEDPEDLADVTPKKLKEKKS